MQPPLFDRAPPFDPEAEIGVLGSIMLLPEVCEDVALLLRPDDFFDEAHRKIYEHMLAMHAAGRKIDPTLLVDKLKAGGSYESIGGAAYLGKVLHSVPNAAHAVFYAEIVHKLAVRRSLIEKASDILRRAYDDGEDGAELAGEASTALATLAVDGSSHHSRLEGDIARDTIARILAVAGAPTKQGVMTGLSVVDEAAGPMLGGELYVYAARPGGGKTAIATGIAAHNARRKRQVLFASLEMSEHELVRRRLCQLAGLDSRDVRSGFLSDDDRLKLEQACNDLQGLPTRIWSPTRATVAQIRGEFRYYKRTSGLDLGVIDYLSLIRPTSEERRQPRHEQVAGFTAEIKALAKELDIPIILLCQLNREAEESPPKLSHLRESGAIEQDADAVMFLYHPPKRGSAPNTGPEREAHLIIAKHRHGEIGMVRLNWVPRETMFYSPEQF